MCASNPVCYEGKVYYPSRHLPAGWEACPACSDLCPKCNGEGFDRGPCIPLPCRMCEGQGVLPKRKEPA